MNPIHEHESDGTWGFWNEVWADCMGAWATEEEANDALNRYCKYLEDGTPWI